MYPIGSVRTTAIMGKIADLTDIQMSLIDTAFI